MSWGQPRSIPKDSVYHLQPDYSVNVYAGEKINREDSILYMMQGDSTLGMGDSIWLISYLRDIYRIKAHRRVPITICSSKTINDFYSNFLPSSFIFEDEYITEEKFNTFTHKLPAMYYWHEKDDSDKSWTDNKSIIARTYALTGMEYQSLPDFGEFTNEEILYPSNSFYKKLNINKNDRYCFFQWHSSGECKNIPPETNIKIIKHIVKEYGLKVYIIGRLNCLNKLEKIKGVKNLSNKTTGLDVFSLAFNAELIISPDSAGVHLGEAFQRPAVGILATLPPSYIAHKYKFPTFMFGDGFCQFKPCGHITKFPEQKCPHKKAQKYCEILKHVDLDLLDKCIKKAKENVELYRNIDSINFYESQKIPIN
jgi:ADP-heptose:LPS heptosyltransferase